MQKQAALVVAALAWSAMTGAASAGTVEVRPSTSPAAGNFFTFMADHGERNDVVLSIRADGAFDVIDRTAALVAGDGCTQVDAQRAICPVPDLASGSFQLMDEDDAYTGPATLSAADPNVYLQVGTDGGDDVVRGGAAHEHISNFGGDDAVSGGPGDDSYFQWAEEGVTITLDGVANDGPPGGRSNVAADVERLSGGLGPDVLVGGPGANSLLGGDGDDVLVGGDGPDHLTGGNGNDRFEGGGGDDVFYADDHPATAWSDRLVCGDGADYGWGDDPDVGASDCEDFITPSRPFRSREHTPPMPDVRAVAHFRRRALLVRLTCPAGTVDCEGTVAVHAKRIRLARRRFMVAPGRTTRVRMPLTRRGARLLRDRRRIRALARLTTDGSPARTLRLVVRRRR
jgi:hypothetical protein